MRRLVLLLSVLFACHALEAQDEAIFTHYNINPVLINPAAVGADDAYQFLLNARASWSGFPGAPKTYGAQFNGPLGNTFGIGVGVLSETAAQLSRVRGKLNFAFRFPIGDNVKLSTGFSTEFQEVKISNDVLANNFFQLGDRILEDAMDGQMEFDASLGVFTTFNEDTYVGLTIANLVRARLDGIVTQENQGSLFEYFTFQAGHRIKIQELNFSLEPSVMIRQVRNAPFQVDFNLIGSFLEEENLLAGLSYRSIGAVGVLLGTQLPAFQLFYSYDLSFQKFQQYNGGSHEVTVAFSLKRKTKRR